MYINKMKQIGVEKKGNHIYTSSRIHIYVHRCANGHSKFDDHNTAAGVIDL